MLFVFKIIKNAITVLCAAHSRVGICSVYFILTHSQLRERDKQGGKPIMSLPHKQIKKIVLS